MSKILEIYPHEKHIADNSVDTTKLSSTAQTALGDFADLKADAKAKADADAKAKAEANEITLPWGAKF